VVIWRYVRSAPLTYCWLLILLATTIVQRTLSRREVDTLLVERSTNLHHLATDPAHVLFASLFWIDGSIWLPYALFYSIVHAPAERWLGGLRWLVVGLAAHIGATYISEGLLALAIRHGQASPSLVDTRDIGVSYFLAGIVGVLTYRVPRPWRWVYLAAVLIGFGLPLVIGVDFTDIGHFSAVVIGLAAYPLTCGRVPPPTKSAPEKRE
jgi:hypothetical protein